MPDFYSPDGNYEVWEEKPEGYFTADEWYELHPLPEPEPEPEPGLEDEVAEVKTLLNAIMGVSDE